MLLTSVKLISKLSSLQNSIDTKVLIIDDTVEIKRGKYSVSGEVPEFILEHMKKDRDLDLAKINNGKRNILPIPATFVIGKDGLVAWQYTSVDFRTRAEPDDIIKALKELKRDKEINEY